MNQETSVNLGRYQHYKGHEYSVLGVARHSETLEELVVYRQEYGERGLWVRPRPMFCETIEVDGQTVPRFCPVANEEGTELGETAGNLFAGLPKCLPAELFQTILSRPQVRIERIVSQGHTTPSGEWFDQDQSEWVVVLQGAARLAFEGSESIEINPGDYINIPAHRRHRVEWTTAHEPTIWLAIHYSD